MDVIFTGIFVTVGLLVLAFIAYSATTKKIIKSQEQEIEILRRDNERLKSAISGARYVTKLALDPDHVKPLAKYLITNPSETIRENAKDFFKEF